MVSAKGQALIRQAQRVPHAALRRPGNGHQALRVNDGPSAFQYRLHPACHIPDGQPVKIKPLAPGDNGGWDPLGFRGGQDEHHMARRLLQGLKQGVKGIGREGVRLIDDIDLGAQFQRGIAYLIQYGADILHPVVAGCVQLHDIHMIPLGALACRTLAAGLPALGLLAVHGTGQNFCGAGLARPTGTCKQVGMGGLSSLHLIFQDGGNMILADHLGKGGGPILPVQCPISHGMSPSLYWVYLNTFSPRCQLRGDGL